MGGVGEPADGPGVIQVQVRLQHEAHALRSDVELPQLVEAALLFLQDRPVDLDRIPPGAARVGGALDGGAASMITLPPGWVTRNHGTGPRKARPGPGSS